MLDWTQAATIATAADVRKHTPRGRSVYLRISELHDSVRVSQTAVVELVRRGAKLLALHDTLLDVCYLRPADTH